MVRIPIQYESRADFGWPATPAGSAPCDQGLVVHYDGSDQGLAAKGHDACRKYWKDTRVFHMGPARNWLDIGYSFGCCPHGVVFEGRGWQRVQAAQPGGNSTWTSCTFMSGEHEKPTPAQVAAFRELRAWLRGKGLGAAVSYHGRFISTSCPGAILRGMVNDGSLISGGVTEEEDVLKTVVDLGAKKPQTIKAGGRESLAFEVEFADPDKAHTDAGKDGVRFPSIFPAGPRGPYVIRLAFELAGDPAGPVTAVWAEYERDSNTLKGDHSPTRLLAAEQVVTWLEQAGSTAKYRVDVINGSAADVVVNRAYLLMAH